MPKKGDQTVLVGNEDGPSSPDSQLYLYVGTKVRTHGSTAMRRNGLDNGSMYALAPVDPTHLNEVVFQAGTIEVKWVEIPGAEALTDVELEAASDAIGAFGFIRIEDGAFDEANPDDYYFVTTGGAAGNMLGRLYHLRFDPNDVLGVGKLTVIYNGDQVDAAGGDTAFAPDNIAVGGQYIMINEDGTAQSRPEYASRARDGSVWRFDIANNFARTRVAELNPPGRDGVAVGAGIWETSGIIDTSRAFGKGSWLMDVQAHSPTAAPGANTVEDGQLVLMHRTSFTALVSD